MGRRRQEPDSGLFELLKILPSWAGPIISIGVFVLVRYVLAYPLTPKPGRPDFGAIIRMMLPMLAWFMSGAILFAWGVVEISKLTNRRLLDRQNGLESIKEISWQEFERLVCEAYRRQGYLAEVVGSPSGDGGIDIILTGRGEKIIVQCKQWRAYKVGVTTVRELLGVVVSEKASRGILVTSGRFTVEAQSFGEKNSLIELMDGPALAELIRTVQTEPTSRAAVNALTPTPMAPAAAAPPKCPTCGSGMVMRTARQGKNSGSQFWGCSMFKDKGCRGSRPVGGQ